jgi:hypothetical protein
MTKGWPYLSIHWISPISHANRKCISSDIWICSFLCYPCYRVRAARIWCPVPLLLRLHVLVMEFMGKIYISVCQPNTCLRNNVQSSNMLSLLALQQNCIVECTLISWFGIKERRLGCSSSQGHCFVRWQVAWKLLWGT